MARMSFSERYKQRKEGGAVTASSSESTTKGKSFSERYNAQKLERTLNLESLDSDLKTLSETVNRAYGGWQDADTMKNTKDAITAMQSRLSGYKQYVNSTGTGDLTKFNQDMDELISGYQSALDNWDGLSGAYSQFVTADAYNAAKRNHELSEKYKGLDYEGVRAASLNSEDADWLSEYGVNVGYSSLKDYNTELRDVSNKLASLHGEEKEKLQAYYDNLQAAANRYAQNNASEKYNYLMEKEDFAERSKYQSTQSKNTILGMEYTEYGDEVYEFINDYNGTRGDLIARDKDGNGPTDLEKTNYQYMTDEEVGMFNYLYSENQEAAYDFLDDIEVTLSKRAYDKTTETWKKWADDSALASAGMSALTPILNMAGGIGNTLATLGEVVTGKEYNPYSGLRMPSNAATDIRQYVGENIAESTEGMEIAGQNVPSFLYQTGMSIADTALGAKMFGKGFTAIMGMNSATQKAKELKEAGEDSATVAKGAVAAGLAEALFEKLSIDNILKPKNATTFAGVLRETAKQMGIEASEEMFTEIANIVSDTLIRQNTSDLAEAYEKYLNRGYSESEAKGMLGRDILSNVAWAGIGGAVSGGVMGSVQSGFQYAANREVAKALLKEEQAKAKGKVPEVAPVQPMTEIEMMAEEMDETMADDFVALYKDGTDAREYKDSFELVFSYGKHGFGTENVLKNRGVLTEEQAVKVYEAGIRSVNMKRQKQIDEVTAKYFTSTTPGRFDDSKVDYSKINSRQKAAVEFTRMLSKATGINVEYFQSEADEDGRRTAENGRFDRSTNTIYLDVYAGVNEDIAQDSIIPTLSHETTHWMKDKAPAAYTKLSEIIMDTLAAEHQASPVDLVQAEMQRFKDANGRDISEEYAQDELIARACEDMLSGNWSVQEMVSKMDETTAKTFSERLKVAFDKIKQWLADLLGTYKSNSEEAKIVQKYADRVNQLQEAWDDAFDKAVKANASGWQNVEDAEVQYSDRDTNWTLKGYSEKQRENWKGSKRIVLYNSKEQLMDFVNTSLSDKTYSKKMYFGMTSDDVSNEVQNRFGIDIHDFNLSLGGNEIRKIMKKHGNAESENLSGQREVTKEDFYQIPFVISKPTNIMAGGEYEGKPCLMFKRDGYSVVGVVSDKHIDLFVQTMYIKKNRSLATPPSDENILLQTSETPSSTASNNSIPHSGENATENIQYSERDSQGNGLTKEQVEYFKESKVRDENGNLKPMYHGTGRADRVGYHFRADRATAGPMAFFTDSKKIADNYARDKQDTSIAQDEMYADYYSQFRIEVNGQNLSVSEAWNKLPAAKRTEISKRAPHITWDDDMENIVYDENVDRGTGGFDRYRINEHKGNYLSALTGEWLEDGTLYGNEEMFLEVLSLAGLDNVQYMDPNARFEKTYQVYLNVTNPFVTTDISEDMLQALKEAAEDTETETGNSAYAWDKRNFSPEAWINKLEADIVNGTTFSWTSIPDFVTETLKLHGYDGIFDEGGKRGGTGHQVVIPFYSNQIKDITNQSPTNHEDIRYSERTTQSIYDAVGEAKRLRKENERLKKDVERLRQRNKLERTVTGGTVLNEKQVEQAASMILRDADSTYDKEALVEELKEVYKYLQSDDVTWDVFMLKSTEVAQHVMGDKRTRTIPNDYAKEILYTLRNTKVKLSDTQKAEARYTYGKDWHRAYFGRVLVSNDGIPIESAWQEWAEIYPDVFDADISDVDMAIEVLNAYDTVKASSEIAEVFDKTEMEREIAIEIYNQFWNIAPVRTLADKYEREIANLKHEKSREIYEKRLAAARKYDDAMKKIRQEHRAEMQSLKAEYTQKKNDAVKQTKERYEKIIKELRMKRVDEVRDIKQRSAERLAAYKENEQRRNSVKRITTNSMRLNQWLTENSAKKHVPEPVKKTVAKFLSSIDFSSKQMLRGGDPTKADMELIEALEQVREMAAAVEGMHTSEAEDVEAYYGAYLDLPKGFTEQLTSICKQVNTIIRTGGEDTHVLNAMTLEQLDSLDKAVSILKHAIGQMNDFIADSRTGSVSTQAQKTILELDALGEQGTSSKQGEWLRKFFHWDNALPYYAFKRLGEGGRAIYRAFQTGWSKLAFHTKAIKEFTEATYTAEEARTWLKEVHEFELEVKGKKKTVKINTAQLMSLYCLAKRAQAIEHLKGGGIRIGNFEVGNKTISQAFGIKLNAATINQLTGELTARQKEVADQLQAYMNGTCAAWGNEVSMKRFGYRAFTEENYFPIQSDKSNLKTNDATEQDNSLYRLLNMSFTKKLTKHANNRLVLNDIFTVFAQHTSDMAKYNALALPVLDAFKWYNYMEQQDAVDGEGFENSSVKESMERAYGEAAKKYFLQFMRDINGSQSAGVGDELAKTFMGKYKAAAVAGNLRVVALQPLSYVRALNVMDAKYLTNAIFKKSAAEKAMKYSGIAVWKSMGFYDTNISRNVQSMIKHDETWRDKVIDKSLALAGMADRYTWGKLWNACEAEIKDTRPELRYGSEAFNQIVAERFEEVIYATQVVDSTLTRTQLMRSKSAYTQMLTSFMSEPMVSYNMLMDCYMDWQADARKSDTSTAWKKNGKKIQRAVVTFTVSAALTAAVEGIIDAWRDDDEDEEFGEKLLENTMSSFVNNINPLATVPFVRDIITMLEGFDVSRMDTEVLSSLVYAYKGIERDIEKGSLSWKTTYNSLRALSQTTGMPFSNVARELVAIWNNTVGEIYPSLKIK
ncbi:MAG: hypothetical protein IJ353_04910 [Lachnospiraceae bacterium]|nr:hypothetical protein [Lachnospiraceae bacterium]